MTLHGDAAKTEATGARHTWLRAVLAEKAHTRPEQLLLDVAMLPDREAHRANYRGACW